MKKYFFCYDEELSRFLTKEKRVSCITTAINPRSKAMFWLYEQTSELSEAMEQRKAKTIKQ